MSKPEPARVHRIVSPAGLAVAITLGLLLITGWFLWRQLGSTWLLLGAHPEVLSELEESLAEQRELARLQPDDEETIREHFDERQKLVQRLRILELNRDRLVRVLGAFVAGLITVVVLLGSGLVLFFRRLRTLRLERLRRALEDLSAGKQQVGLVDEGGGTIGRIASMVEDVSMTVGEQRRRLQELDALHAWREGSRRIGHEMRTPLTAIRLDLQQLGDHLEPGVSNAAGLNATYQRVMRDFDALRKLVVRITGSAQLPEPKLVPLDLQVLVQDFITTFARAWPRLTLCLDRSSDTANVNCWVNGDSELLRQVLVNLVSNVDEALSRERGVDATGEVHFALAALSDEVSLNVIDNGPGVNGALADQLFQPYVRGFRAGDTDDCQPSTNDHAPRLGLGLAISRMILLEHGGTLDLLERPGQENDGATFRLSLPLTSNRLEGSPA